MADSTQCSPMSVYDSPSDVPIDRVDSLLDSLRPLYSSHHQSHLFDFVETLTSNEKQQLYFDLTHIQVQHVKRDYDNVIKQEQAALGSSPASITPFMNVSNLATTSPSQSTAWRNKGLDLIAAGEVAALLMAGGQGTRLGSSQPKGCFDIRLLSHKSLFQIQAERIVRLREVAAQHAKINVDQVHIKWYIMTSIVTHSATLAFFRSHNFFGLPESDLYFFQQSELPALSNDGKIILEQKHRVALAPNGNGGIFEGVKRQGALEHMKRNGIKYIHVYGVDNVLAKVADPTFIGFAVDKQADCANKVVLKTDPSEKVGVMCLRDGRPSVVEYSELPSSMSTLRSETTGQLLYSAGNIVQHFFTYEFLEKHALSPLVYHVARKAIPYVDSSGSIVTPSQASGLKLEMFVFDAFERSINMQCLAVDRASEFSPVKNAAGSDSPATARQALALYHYNLLEQAGATIQNKEKLTNSHQDSDCSCEISPLISYSGEGLNQIVAGKSITLPYHLDSESAKLL